MIKAAPAGIQGEDTAAKEDVVFNVSGAAKLVAVDNGDHYSDELFNTNKRKLHNGFAQCILRSAQNKGIVNISAVSKGLKPATLALSTQ